METDLIRHIGITLNADEVAKRAKLDREIDDEGDYTVAADAYATARRMRTMFAEWVESLED